MAEIEHEIIHNTKTSVALSRHTKDELELFREYKRESTDEILQRLMQIAKKHTTSCEDDELNPKLLLKLKERVKEVNEGRVLSTKQLREKLRNNNGN